MRNREPMISFTFDDFPRSALHVAGRILEDHGIAGTYYVSLGLMGTLTPDRGNVHAG
jgi:peptidoglycan/xylan/chitin deacetylase (PgdA/CDA1 family)